MAGKKIFDTHLVAGCIRCHKVGDKGGIVGPALDGIASRKDADYIRRALINPTADLVAPYDKLGASPMPPMNIILNDQELADVMAYLLTLKKNWKRIYLTNENTIHRRLASKSRAEECP